MLLSVLTQPFDMKVYYVARKGEIVICECRLVGSSLRSVSLLRSNFTCLSSHTLEVLRSNGPEKCQFCGVQHHMHADRSVH